MFWNRKHNERKQLEKEKRKQTYERVLQLHENATFLFYVDDVIYESYQGEQCVKLVGTAAIGSATLEDMYVLYNYAGIKKADIQVEEFYEGADAVNTLIAQEKTVAIYPKQREISYKAGDILCKLDACVE